MKLPIKKKYFDQIKAGSKEVDFKDAHLTLICEETKEKLVVDIIDCRLMNKSSIKSLSLSEKQKLFTDDKVVAFLIRRRNIK